MQQPPDKCEDLEKWMKKLENENELMDDHGALIIGKRESKPVEISLMV